MILDYLDNWERYAALHPGFPAAFEFLKRRDLADLSAAGTHSTVSVYTCLWYNRMAVGGIKPSSKPTGDTLTSSSPSQAQMISAGNLLPVAPATTRSMMMRRTWHSSAMNPTCG